MEKEMNQEVASEVMEEAVENTEEGQINPAFSLNEAYFKANQCSKSLFLG